MILILCGVIAFGLIFIGIGLLVVNPKNQNEITLNEILRKFWIGVVVSIAFLQIWHLFYPVNLTVFFIHCFAAITGYFLARNAISDFIRKLSWGTFLPFILSIVLFALIVSILSIDGNLHFDHGLYHLQTVQWLENYAIVPGLGNVHHRLAFNNASFLYVALLNQSVFSGYSFYISNSLLAWILILHSLLSISILIRKKVIASKKDYYYAFILPFLLWYIQNFYFSGYSPDFFISVLQVLIAGEFISLMETKSNEKLEFRNAITQIIVLCILMVCIKLSGLVYAFAFLISTLIIFLKNKQANNSDKGFFITRIIASLFIGIPWLIRSVILSGYLLYPSSIISFNLPWNIPKSMVDPITDVIYNWSRYGNTISPETSFIEWLPQWLWTVPRGLKEGLILAALLTLGMIVILIFRRFSLKQYLGLIFTILFAVLHIAYWFLIAPEIRFIGMSFWVAFSALFAIFVDWIVRLYPETSSKSIGLLGILIFMLWLSPSLPRDFGIKRNLIKPPSEYKIASEFVSKKNIVTKTTANGLTIYLANDYSKEACWDLPLPCTRVNDYYSKLALVDPDDMQKGFYIKIEK